jgi:hypothetical protein
MLAVMQVRLYCVQDPRGSRGGCGDLGRPRAGGVPRAKGQRKGQSCAGCWWLVFVSALERMRWLVKVAGMARPASTALPHRANQPAHRTCRACSGQQVP